MASDDWEQRAFIAQLARDANQLATVAPRLQRGLGNVVAGVVDQLSTSPLDFIYQLLQNADDKDYEAGVTPEMGFSIKPMRGGYVHAWDNGRAMSNDQVEALVTFRSTKRDDVGTIGEKGVGWHSVFRVSHEPHVYSGGFSFKLGCNSLENMLTPTWVEKHELPFQPRQGTNFFLPLRDLTDATFDELACLREKFSPMTLLFLRKIRRVRIEPQQFAVELDQNVWIVRVRTSSQKVERVVEQAIVVRSPVPKDLPFPTDVRARDPQIIFAFPLMRSGPQHLFAWLPVMPSGLKFLLHGDFVTTLSREHLLEDSWNSWLWQQIPGALVSAVEHLVSPPVGPLHTAWLELWPTNELHIKELQNAILAAERQLRELPVVATSEGLRRPTDCVLAGALEHAIVPESELVHIDRFYPIHKADHVLERLGSKPFSPDLFRSYVAERPGALLRRYEVDEGLFDRVVQYLREHDLQDVACLPVADAHGSRLETPDGQLVALAADQIPQLAQMGLRVVRANGGPVTRAWLEGVGLHPATPQAVLEAILGAGECTPAISALHVQYIYQVWDQLSATSCERVARELLVWTEASGNISRTTLHQAHVRDPSLLQLFARPPPSCDSRVTSPNSIRFVTPHYDSLGVAALEKLGAWTTVRLEERCTEVPFAHRSHDLMMEWMQTDKLPSTSKTYKFYYWALPSDLCKYIEHAPASIKTAFLELVASRWQSYESRRTLRLQHTFRSSRRQCPHGENSCEKCSYTLEKRWEFAPFLHHLRKLRVPTTLGAGPEHCRQLDQTILLPPRERARLGGLHLPLPVLAADINSVIFLNACGVATEVSADILLRGLRQLRERPPSDELLRQVQAFYSLLEHVTSDEAFDLTDDWPILACDPCPTELERRALEGPGGSIKERQQALKSQICSSLRWFSLRDVRWEGPASIVHGHFALLAHQRTSDARRVYTRFIADILRVPDVGPSDLVDLLEELACKLRLPRDHVDTVVRIYEELALCTRSNSLDEYLLERVRRRLLTHRFEFVSGQVFAHDNPQELGLASQADIHFLHFPNAVAAHHRFLVQLRVPLAKDSLKTTYVGTSGKLDRSATETMRCRLEWLVRASLHLLPEARMLPASSWAPLAEFARVENVQEVVVKVQLGAAQITRRVRYAVDSGTERCAVVLSKDNRWSRSFRGKRLLTQGTSELLASVCGTSASTELVRLVGLILATPQEELHELAEDECLYPLPLPVKLALGQKKSSGPATLLAPLRDTEDTEEAGPNQALAEGEFSVDNSGIIAANTDVPMNSTIEPPPGLTQQRAQESASPEEPVKAFLEPEAMPVMVDTQLGVRSHEEEAYVEAARLRLEAALAHEDAKEAQLVLKECPGIADDEFLERVQVLVEKQALVDMVRSAISATQDKQEGSVEVLRQVVQRAERSRIRSIALHDALVHARKIIQEADRQARCRAALTHLTECRASDSPNPATIDELETVLVEAWEAGVDQEHPDFVWALMQLEARRLRAACEAVELALHGNGHDLAASARNLQMQLTRVEKLPFEDQQRQMASVLLQQVAYNQAVTQNLSDALAIMDPISVRQCLEQAKMVPSAAGLVEHASRWLQQHEEHDHRRGLALEQLASALDIEQFGSALYAARECCSLDELEPFERRFVECCAAAERTRASLMDAQNIEMLRDAIALLPPNILPAAEVHQWNAKLEQLEFNISLVEAELDTVDCEDTDSLQGIFEKALSFGAGPQTIERIRNIVRDAHNKHAAQNAERLQAEQYRYHEEREATKWMRYLHEAPEVCSESVETAAVFAREVQDQRLLQSAEAMLRKLAQADTSWRVAEQSRTAVDWRVAAAACRACRQLQRSRDADARARQAQEREDVERRLCSEPLGDDKLLPALQRACDLGVSGDQIAAARARVSKSVRDAKFGPLQNIAEDSDTFLDCKRVLQSVLPGAYGVKLLGRWERISPVGAEALVDLGLLDEDSKLRCGPTDLPLHVVTKPHKVGPVEGDILGKEMRKAEQKLAEIAKLEEKILAKDRLKQEEWHKVAHKAVHLHEVQRLQAKIAANTGAREDTVSFSEVWEAVEVVKRNAGSDPFERHLLEGAPAELRTGPSWSPPAPVRSGPSGHTADRIGALGELYVFTWLQQLVDGFGFENWCSSRRTAHPDAPPPEPDLDSEGCDFKFHDRDGLFQQYRDVFVEVKSMRVQGDPSQARASDFCCHLSSNELAKIRSAGESDTEYYVMLWVAVGCNLECRVVAVLRQPAMLIPRQLKLQPTEYLVSLNSTGAPPGLAPI